MNMWSPEQTSARVRCAIRGVRRKYFLLDFSMEEKGEGHTCCASSLFLQLQRVLWAVLT